MRGIEVSGIHDGTFIFTVTERDQAPWGTSNTTIFIAPEHLDGLIARLQARREEIDHIRQTTPAFSMSQQVRVLGHFRQGQQGRVVGMEQKSGRMRQMTGEHWAYTVAFRDGSTWVYNVDDLEPFDQVV